MSDFDYKAKLKELVLENKDLKEKLSEKTSSNIDLRKQIVDLKKKIKIIKLEAVIDNAKREIKKINMRVDLSPIFDESEPHKPITREAMMKNAKKRLENKKILDDLI